MKFGVGLILTHALMADASLLSDSSSDLLADSSGEDVGAERSPKRRRRMSGGLSPEELDDDGCILSSSGSASSSSSQEGGLLLDEGEFGGLCPEAHGDLYLELRRLQPFQWAFGVLKCLSEFVGAASLRRSLLLEGCSFSSHFSGIGTAEKAAKCLGRAASDAIGFTFSFQPLWACESSTACQRRLRRSPDDACLFDNILDISPAAKALAERLQASGAALDFKEEWPRLQNGGLSPNMRVCRIHDNAFCQVGARPDFDVSGSPCQQWSRFGKREGRSSHLTVLFLAWAHWAKIVRPLVLIHENVVGFDSSLLQETLGGLYDLVVLNVEPAHAAFPMVARPRSYAVLFLRDHVEHIVPVSTLYDQVEQAFLRNVPRPSLSSLCVAEEWCCLAEENKLRGAKGLPNLEKLSGDWSYLLTDKQRNYLSLYQAACPPAAQIEKQVFDLSQNPKARQRSCSNGVLPTITQKSGRLWLPGKGRWLLPCELAYAQGFVVTPSASEDAKVQQDVESYTLAQIGNSMHVASVGSVMAIALASVRRVAMPGSARV